MSLSVASFAQVTVSFQAPPPACQSTLSALPNIVITESGNNDFNITEGTKQIIIQAASGRFEGKSGSIVADFSNQGATVIDGSVTAQVSVSEHEDGNQLIINLSENDPSHADVPNTLTIRGMNYFSGGEPGNIDFTIGDNNINGLTFGQVIASITVKASPIVSEQSPIAICSGQNVDFNLQGATSITSTFAWIVYYDDPNIEGESLEEKPGNVINDVLINNINESLSVSYVIFPTSTDGCSGPSFPLSVTVNPTPVLGGSTPPLVVGKAGGPSSYCSGIPLEAMLETTEGSVGADHFTINSITTSGPLAPGASNTEAGPNKGSDAIFNDVWTNSSILVRTVTYSVTPISGAGCTGAAADVVYTINPVPVVTVTNNKPVISSGMATNIALTSSIPGSMFQYSFQGTEEISGGTEGTKASISQQLTNNTTSLQEVSYLITAFSPEGCYSAQETATVIVKGHKTITTADSIALVAFFNATNGNGWVTKDHWLEGPVADGDQTWYGVEVNENRVTSLSLPSNNLTGTLPAGFYDLTQLQLINLHNNAIGGTLSNAIGNLTNLQTLDLSHNTLTGDLPTSLYDLTGLMIVELGHNQITGGISPSIANLTGLQYLDLGSLPLTGTIAPEVFNLSGLYELSLSGKLNGPVPATIGNMESLTKFNCENCGITALPSEIGNLSSLSEVNLSGNQLAQLPAFNEGLSTLNIAKNKLTFEDLVPLAEMSESLTYAPQDSVGTKTITIIQTETPHKIMFTVGGSGNEYKWKKNNAVVNGANQSSIDLPSPTFTDEGSYILEATNPSFLELTLISRAAVIKVSSLKRDSLSLVQVYNATEGANWTNKTGWLTGRLSTWNGVTIAANRVTALNLPNNNLTGSIPAAITDILNLTTINLSGNKISDLPKLTTLAHITSVNVSGNRLEFAPLELNAAMLAKITYSNQAEIGTARRVTIAAGSPYTINVTVTGANNHYQWKKNKANIPSATENSYHIAEMNRSAMAEYFCEITNITVPGLTLKSAAEDVVAITDLSGSLSMPGSIPVTNGTLTLLKVTNAGAYETVSVKKVNTNGTFTFNDVVLADYQILGFPDTITYERALPTYYKKTILWEEADIIQVNGTLTNLDIVAEVEPGAAPSEKGSISGYVEELDNATAGRTKAPKRVANAGVSARRVENASRGKDGEVLTLVAYVFTDENGKFNITNLPLGKYRLNIQYPGYPMNENSFITIPIGTALQSHVEVEAFVEQGQITVRQLVITEVWSQENYATEVFPNPSSEFINIRFDSPSQSREVNMIDITGKKIKNTDAPGTEVSLDVRSVNPGNYFLNIYDRGAIVKTLQVIVK